MGHDNHGEGSGWGVVAIIVGLLLALLAFVGCGALLFFGRATTGPGVAAPAPPAAATPERANDSE